MTAFGKDKWTRIQEPGMKESLQIGFGSVTSRFNKLQKPEDDMPITIQLPEGIFSRDEEAALVRGLSEILLEVNGAAENPFVRKHLVVAVTTIPQDRLYADCERVLWANITLRVPPFSLSKYDQQKEFVARMTDLFDSVSQDRVPRDRLYINRIWGDDFWGIGGHTWSNHELLQTVIEAGQSK